MCGIAGIVSQDSHVIDREILKKMNHTLRRRGPDDEGYYFSQNVGLAHARLSIIDLSSGHQPMTTDDGRYTIVFNGEIYNFLEIRERLSKLGLAFHTHSDTEVLLKLLVHSGPEGLKELNGMFAFVIWDDVEKTLFAARDRMGKKPFYWAQINNHFIFASELKALLKFPDLPKKLNEKALPYYLTFEYVPAPFTMIEGVNKLKPAHYLFLKNGHVSMERYWNQPFGQALEVDDKTATRTLLELLDKATAYRLISDVPLGVFLSGGIDSSAVVALMARQREGKDIKTFSINFKEASYDESLFSQTVAQKFGTDHHEETLSAQRMLEILPEVTDYLDEPLADGSILPTYLLSRFTRQHVKVALGGDGSDELFAGYPTFLASRLAGWYQGLPGFIKMLIIKASQLLPTSDKNMSLDFKLRQFLMGAEHAGVLKNQVWLSAVPPAQHQDLLHPDLFARTRSQDTLGFIATEMENCRSSHPGDQLLYFYQKFYMSDDILVKVDRASMANSLEVRAPFLDKDVVDYVCRLPYHFKLKGVTTKYLLKKTFNRMLPAMITQRSKKGFGIPIAGWLKQELKPLMLATLSRERILAEGLFNWEYVNRLVQEHVQQKYNHRKPLFALLMLHFWMERYLR